MSKITFYMIKNNHVSSNNRNFFEDKSNDPVNFLCFSFNMPFQHIFQLSSH
jgi:hypothetical protein